MLLDDPAGKSRSAKAVSAAMWCGAPSSDQAQRRPVQARPAPLYDAPSCDDCTAHGGEAGRRGVVRFGKEGRDDNGLGRSLTLCVTGVEGEATEGDSDDGGKTVVTIDGLMPMGPGSTPRNESACRQPPSLIGLAAIARLGDGRHHRNEAQHGRPAPQRGRKHRTASAGSRRIAGIGGTRCPQPYCSDMGLRPACAKILSGD